MNYWQPSPKIKCARYWTSPGSCKPGRSRRSGGASAPVSSHGPTDRMRRTTPKPISSRIARHESRRCRPDSVPQFGGATTKLRPALVLVLLPGPYQNVLLCGVSTQLHLILPNWDELIQTTDADFPGSGLHQASVIRLSYLYAADASEITGVIGSIDPARLARLRTRLADHLRP